MSGESTAWGGCTSCGATTFECSACGAALDGENLAGYREQAEALIADLRARVSHYEALLVAVREETLTKAALSVDALFLRVKGFGEPWDRGYTQAVKDAAYAVRELRLTPPDSEQAR